MNVISVLNAFVHIYSMVNSRILINISSLNKSDVKHSGQRVLDEHCTKRDWKQAASDGQSTRHRVNMRLVCFLSSPKWDGLFTVLLPALVLNIACWPLLWEKYLSELSEPPCSSCVSTVTWNLHPNITDAVSSPCPDLGKLTYCLPRTLDLPETLLNQRVFLLGAGWDTSSNSVWVLPCLSSGYSLLAFFSCLTVILVFPIVRIYTLKFLFNCIYESIFQLNPLHRQLRPIPLKTPVGLLCKFKLSH